MVDNDVALKVVCYTLPHEMVAATTIDGDAPSLLGIARFVISNRLKTASNIANKEAAVEAFRQLLSEVGTVEPDQAELAMAADLESEAVRQNVELDGGESQLVAILVSRACELLLTGDKRAISAMEVVAPIEVHGRVACFEQVVSEIVRQAGTETARKHICSEPRVDKTMAVCFSCASANAPSEADVCAGLKSYIDHLAKMAPNILVPGYGLDEVRSASAGRVGTQHTARKVLQRG